MHIVHWSDFIFLDLVLWIWGGGGTSQIAMKDQHNLFKWGCSQTYKWLPPRSLCHLRDFSIWRRELPFSLSTIWLYISPIYLFAIIIFLVVQENIPMGDMKTEVHDSLPKRKEEKIYIYYSWYYNSSYFWS